MHTTQHDTTLTSTNDTDPALYEGKCPENKVTYSAPPVCQVDAGKGTYGPSTNFTSQNDFAQMRVSPPSPPLTHRDQRGTHSSSSGWLSQELGFNLVRLTLNWNLLEPQPGNYSQQYLDRIAQVGSL